ncbi:hypothetical protein [Brevibacillus sp. FSL L8-0710]|uniref:hypothetical protein n=1 Tax=Brevibacillus sp. FSL L8-0710 TaxID=2975313 RepID=UPI0030FAE888
MVTIDIDKDIPEEKWLQIQRLVGLEVIELVAEYCEPDEEGVEDGQMNMDQVREGIPYTIDGGGPVELSGPDRTVADFEAARKAAEEQEPF